MNVNDFFSDLLESKDETYLILMDNFKKVLNGINHPISKKLLNMINFRELSKYSFIDIIDNERDFLIFVNSNKAIEFLKNNLIEITYDNLQRYKQTILHKYGCKIKIGKLINKIFKNEFVLNGDTGQDIESFISEYKSYFTTDEELFDIVNGVDIVKWYNEKNYLYSTGPLNHSCMRYDSCSQYINFYAINTEKINLLIKYENKSKNKIVGRALLWKLDKIDGNKTNLLFMDRVYFINENVLNSFISYAKSHGFIYKMSQNTNPECTLIYSKDETKNKKMLLEVFDIKCDINNLTFPFMDTLYRYNPYEKILSNTTKTDKYYVRLGSTRGSVNIVKSKKYNSVIVFNDEYVFSLVEKDYLKKEDAVQIDRIDNWIDKTKIPNGYKLDVYKKIYVKQLNYIT